jgi:hypothetical protein
MVMIRQKTLVLKKQQPESKIVDETIDLSNFDHFGGEDALNSFYYNLVSDMFECHAISRIHNEYDVDIEDLKEHFIIYFRFLLEAD